MSDASPRRETQLDGLRFLAFLAVFEFHAGRCPWGWIGVPFFFSLSGFLITRILIRTESGDLGADLKRFYWRRTLRIFPLYYGIITWVALTSSLPHLGWYLAYLSNVRSYLDGYLAGPLSHFWTLAVEEQFYILYPLILLRTPARWRAPLVLTLMVATKAFQAYALTHLTMPVARVLLPYCGEDLLWGSLAGMVDLRHPSWGRGRGAGTLMVLVGAPTTAVGYLLRERMLGGPPPGQEWLGLSLLGLGNTLVVAGAWRTSNPVILWPLTVRPMVWLGTISYGLYAFHMPVLVDDWMTRIPFGFLIPRRSGALVLTVALAALSWRYWERPINRLKEHSPREAAAIVRARIRQFVMNFDAFEAKVRRKLDRRRPG